MNNTQYDIRYAAALALVPQVKKLLLATCQPESYFHEAAWSWDDGEMAVTIVNANATTVHEAISAVAFEIAKLVRK